MSYEILLERYKTGRISEAMLAVYVKKGIITQQQYKEIMQSK